MIINGMLSSFDYVRSASGVWSHKDHEGDPVAQWLAEELEANYQNAKVKGTPVTYYPERIYFEDFERFYEGNEKKWRYTELVSKYKGVITEPKWIQSLNNYEAGHPQYNDIKVFQSRSKPITEEEVAELVKPEKREVVAHYTTGEIETIDFIFDKLGFEGGMAYIIGNLMKYPSRANHKGCRRADIIKLRNYAIIAIEKMDKEGETE